MDFYEHLKKYLSETEIEKLNSEINKKAKKSLIINTNKTDDSFILSHFNNLIPHPLVPHCYLYNEDEYQLGKHIFFEQGLYYIFEPCSALVNYILSPNENDLVLDLCASPGGKTSHLAILKKQKGIIISNEISKDRCLILSSNVERMGFKNVIVTNNSIDDFKDFENCFDKIILDAPCSGSGMFRKENKMLLDWSYNKVTTLSSLQKELINKAYQLLKPGGKLVYSTCSFSYEEDEEVIQDLLNKTDAILEDIPDHPMFFKSSSKIGIHLFPFLFPGEGHYICLIKKPGTLEQNAQEKNISSLEFSKIEKICNVKGYIFEKNNTYYLLPEKFNFKNLKVIRGGVKLGTNEKYGFDFDHALSHYLTSFPYQIELNQEQAKLYLSGNSFHVDSQDGIVLLSYLNNPLGFGKITKGRLNNKYPKGLRRTNIIL